MPSFDVVCETDKHEITNAIDQANREVGTRFDFKGSDSRVSKQENVLILESQSKFQVEQILDILRTKLVKRGIDLLCLDPGEIKEVGSRAKQEITVREGLDQDLARKIVR